MYKSIGVVLFVCTKNLDFAFSTSLYILKIALTNKLIEDKLQASHPEELNKIKELCNATDNGLSEMKKGMLKSEIATPSITTSRGMTLYNPA